MSPLFYVVSHSSVGQPGFFLKAKLEKCKTSSKRMAPITFYWPRQVTRQGQIQETKNYTPPLIGKSLQVLLQKA